MRFKHRYKSCLWSRTDIWGNLLIKRKTFLRPKWDAMIGILGSQRRRRRPLQKSEFNQPRHAIVNDFRYLKTRLRANQTFKYNRWGYRNTLSILFSLRRFYGDISHKSFKAFCISWYNKKNPSLKLLGALEGRLDICLYRLGYFHSIYYSRQAILHHKVLVNGEKIGFGGYVLKKGDLVEFCPHQRSIIQTRLFSRYKRFIRLIIPKWSLPYPTRFFLGMRPTPNWVQTEYSNLSFILSSNVNVPVVYSFRAHIDDALWSAKYGYM